MPNPLTRAPPWDGQDLRSSACNFDAVEGPDGPCSVVAVVSSPRGRNVWTGPTMQGGVQIPAATDSSSRLNTPTRLVSSLGVSAYAEGAA
jgi:hypothetical protein